MIRLEECVVGRRAPFSSKQYLVFWYHAKSTYSVEVMYRLLSHVHQELEVTEYLVFLPPVMG